MICILKSSSLGPNTEVSNLALVCECGIFSKYFKKEAQKFNTFQMCIGHLIVLYFPSYLLRLKTFSHL